MQKLNMIDAYRELPEGVNAVFYHPEGQQDQARLIKMRINAPQSANLWLTPVDRIDVETGEVDETSIFLGHVDAGLEQIEFYYKGTFALSSLGGSVWLDTYDNTAFSVEAADFTNYARLWEREERDPRILEIERAARHNQERLMAAMAADREAYSAQMAALAERISSVAPTTPPSDSGTTSPEPVVSSSAPTGDPAATAPVAAPAGGEPDAPD